MFIALFTMRIPLKWKWTKWFLNQLVHWWSLASFIYLLRLYFASSKRIVSILLKSYLHFLSASELHFSLVFISCTTCGIRVYADAFDAQKNLRHTYLLYQLFYIAAFKNAFWIVLSLSVYPSLCPQEILTLNLFAIFEIYLA